MTINAAHENAMSIYCDACWNITMKNCVFHNGSDAGVAGTSAIYVRWADTLVFENVTITGAYWVRCKGARSVSLHEVYKIFVWLVTQSNFLAAFIQMFPEKSRGLCVTYVVDVCSWHGRRKLTHS